MTRDQAGRVEFWAEYQPGFRFTDKSPGSRAFFDEVTRHRYALEPHILAIAPLDAWRGDRVLDVGCGIATDGMEFARRGALYVGLDGSPTAVALAHERFAMYGVAGQVVEGDATALPFEDEAFDHVWSHGVIHHFAETERAVAEMYRVLRKGGTCIVMLYHRHSFNYYVTIMGLRRALAAVLLLPRTSAALGRVTGEDARVFDAHRELLRHHGTRYLRDKALFLSNNTDGPGNPVSKVYSRREALRMFSNAGFADVRTHVRFLNLRSFPKGELLARTPVAERLGCKVGWHLYVTARKP